MIKTKTGYKPQSTYELAYLTILNKYKESGCEPLSVPQVQKLFESTPELCFPAGTTIDEALGKLSGWKLIFRGKIGGLEKDCVVPLKWG